MFPAILFVLFITFLLGIEISQRVPDEVPRARKYVSLIPDTLILIMTGILLVQLGWKIAALSAIVFMVLARRFFPFTHVYAPLSGALLGIGFFLSTETFASLALLCLALNYTVGTLGESTKNVAIRALPQPLFAGGIALALLI